VCCANPDGASLFAHTNSSTSIDHLLLGGRGRAAFEPPNTKKKKKKKKSNKNCAAL
jgi:hypothetical protein